ncbi:hypothetical protein Tco_0807202 [Tanacetum coccineum]
MYWIIEDDVIAAGEARPNIRFLCLILDQEKICRVFIEKQVTVTGLIVMLMRVLKVKNGTKAGITGSDAAVKSLE